MIVWSTFNCNFDTVMQNIPNIENSEIIVSTNRQVSVFFLYNVIRNNPQIPYILVALKIKKTWAKNVKTRFY